ncbi:cation efflux protein [Coniochaeta ligniaria NRRL 30616]|uniref:Cation efflux protein n=1 Tax=Coniochaeta ligniaria NRRL 30616 TaxID=1408157 RepID=A0A1J7IY06_9PEZI|nr:cation efflux protein [Coniochaeta ligniaria NRRL 30616]
MSANEHIFISVAFKTGSLALIADAFHSMNDLLGFSVTNTEIQMSERTASPQDLSFGWQRAQMLGAFFNGVFLLALGISIFLQSIERFITFERVEEPKLVLIMGCIGLTVNTISALFLHGTPSSSAELQPLHPHAEHRHTQCQAKAPGRDLNMLGVMVHVMGDALNNIGVIIAALVIWLTHYEARYYADPGASMGISMMIFLSSIPLVKNSGTILLQSAPRGVDLGDIKHDLENIPGIESVHELHVWRLDQKKAIATAHVMVTDQPVSSFMEKAKTVSECLHAYGIHSATIQPELVATPSGSSEAVASSSVSTTPATVRNRKRPLTTLGACQMLCGKGICENLMCCTAQK